MKNPSAAILMIGLMFAATGMGTGCAKKDLNTGPAAMERTEEKPVSGDTGDMARAVEEKEISEERLRLAEEERAAARAALEKERRTAKEAARFVNDIVYFDFDSSGLNDTAKEQLKRKADWIGANPEPHITIEGHCDLRGTVEYNLALGERRALSVKNYLVDLGVPPGRMTCLSFGEEKPAATADDRKSHEKNRRAQFRIQ